MRAEFEYIFVLRMGEDLPIVKSALTSPVV